MLFFFGHRPSAHERFAKALELNPYHPFVKIGPNKFYFRVRYQRLFIALSVAVISVLAIIILAVLNLVFQFYFVLCVLLLIYSLGVAYTYKHLREYTIDGEEKKYTFKTEKNSAYVGDFHNVYIRLRKRVDSGDTRYYLIFNGYQIEKVILTGSTRNMAALRALGQQLAYNLDINYFDEPNVSTHHVLRHDRPSANKGKGLLGEIELV